MAAWADGVVERLRAFGLEGLDATACEVSDDSHRVRFAIAGRSGGDATCLLLGVDPAGVRAGLALPAAQARGARMRLADPARALELATALEALPEQFMLSASGDDGPAEAQRATADDLRLVLDKVERACVGQASQATIWIGWSLPRELALEHAALLDEQLEDALVALAQVFTLLVEESAAGRDDRLATRARRAPGRSAKGDRPIEEERQRASGTRKEHAARERAGHVRARGRERDRERESDADPEPPEPVSDAPAPRSRAMNVKLPSRPGLWGRLSKGARVAIERGTRVRVLRGAFSGKVGVVHELDGEGSARVMLGLLAVRLEVKNLMPCVEGRPVLSTSHRKPMPDRS